jgi:hypothetical protein
LLVTKLVFAACDTPSLQEDLGENSNKVAADRALSPIVTAAAAAALNDNDNTLAVKSLWL